MLLCVIKPSNKVHSYNVHICIETHSANCTQNGQGSPNDSSRGCFTHDESNANTAEINDANNIEKRDI